MARDDIDRRIGAHSFARLLGDWRPPGGRGLTAALADRVRLLVLDGAAAAADARARGAGARCGLDVSRTTVAAASRALLREAGILNSRRGAGSWTQVPPGPWPRDEFAVLAPRRPRPFDLAASLPAPATELRAAAALAVGTSTRTSPGTATTCWACR